MKKKLAFVLVVYQDLFLLGYNPVKKRYEYFGGHVEDDESYLDCAIRELYEESSGTILARHLTRLSIEPGVRIYLYRLKTKPDFDKFDENRAKYLKMGLKQYAEMSELVLLSVKQVIEMKNSIHQHTLDTIINYLI
jgi:hypothetical protein